MRSHSPGSGQVGPAIAKETRAARSGGTANVRGFGGFCRAGQKIRSRQWPRPFGVQETSGIPKAVGTFPDPQNIRENDIIADFFNLHL